MQTKPLGFNEQWCGVREFSPPGGWEGREPRHVPILGRGEKYPDVGDYSWFSPNVQLVVLNLFYRHCCESGYLSPLTA